ncbi:DUF4845 domain-containing protein [Ectothiorhodospiraceae bacterium WFHF3C12]|nr:DUF4845 domain-containing protein [Ectothiorhodospiraceae bacterium WFHF3C12]
MRMPHKQQGMTLIGWVITLVIIGLVALIALRLVPVYMNSFTVGSIVDGLATDASLNSRDRGEVRRAFEKRLNINDVSVVGASMLQFEDVAGGVRLVVEYDHRVDLMGNLDAVATFRKEAVLRN